MVISLAPHHRSTAAALLRLLAAWLAAILFAQGFAAAQALGTGPLHLHRGGASSAQHTHHHHATAERHHHEAIDASVLVSAEDGAVDTAAFAITAALALLALAATRVTGDGARSVLRAADAWAWRTMVLAALRKPPRLG